jgi:hypothetical protein
VGMSHIKLPKEVGVIVLAPEAQDRPCGFCGGPTRIFETRKRWLKTLDGAKQAWIPVVGCRDEGCEGHGKRQMTPEGLRLAPPHWTVDWELFAWMGHRRFARHWSVPQIRNELLDTHHVEISDDAIEDYTAKYEAMVAARESDVEMLVEAYRDVAYIDLSIDGLQPEKGHETLYVVRELGLKRVWFAAPLLSSAAGEVHRLIERAKEIAERIGKPVRCWMSDKQDAFVTGIEAHFPGVPHRYCQNHFMRDAAKPVLEMDSHAKVQMRRKVRGLRDIERKMLAAKQEDVAEAPDDSPEQVVLDYCAAVRGVLNDDQGGPLSPPGVRMAKGIGEIRNSIDRATAAVGDEKGAAKRRCAPSRVASTAASPSSAMRSKKSQVM